MRKLDVIAFSLALSVLYLQSSWPVRSDKAQDLLTSLEEAVKAIAESATQNYNNSCGLVDTCQSGQNCSRRECFLVKDQDHEYSCVTANNFTKCNSNTNSQCSRLGADFTRGMIRLPGNETVTLKNAQAETVEAAFGPTICTQRPLDATFAAQRDRFSYSNASLFYNHFFGAADGVFRFYPTREILNDNCNTYDPRIRTWYNSAISVKKNVVLLLDTGPSMAEDTEFFSDISPLETVQTLIKNLGQTLTPGDTFTLISLNSSGALPLNDPYAVSSNASNTGEFLEQLLGNAALNNLEFDQVAPSSFTAAFELANATSFNTTGEALKIILLFTDSNDGNLPPTDIVNSTLAPLRNEGVGLFVFDLAPGNASSLWDTAPCRSSSETSGQQYLSIAQQNPLLLLNPYFSFLARARIEANNGSTVFYTKPYNSATDLGRVIGVSYLAMSSDNSVLVGVAGLALQTGGLDDLEADLQRTLDSDNYIRYTNIPTISTFKDPITCSVEYLKNCPSSQEDSFRPICYSSELQEPEPSSDDELERLVCCSGQGCSAGHQKSSIWWVVLATVSGTLLAVFMTIGFIMCRRFKTKRRTSSNYPSPHMYSYEELLRATDRFSRQNIIGEGAFGVVYRGRLRDLEVAVKRLKRTPDKPGDFEDELRVNVTITEHPNLVDLEGACIRDGDYYLVYQFVEGGDLYDWLWPERNALHRASETDKVIFLTWNKREQIATGIAKGLDHLHRGLLGGKVYHLDIKPRNILLGKDFTPKIADFGISQLYEPGRTYKIVAITGGSVGYIAPEVLHGPRLPNSKIDVFSYGVVLLQLVSGRKINDMEVSPYFYKWARQLAESQSIDALIDGYLFEIVQPESRDNLVANCRRIVNVALRCTEEDPDMRPEMVDILDDLKDFLVVRELELPSSDDD